MATARKTINVSEDEYERLTRAAYWEGYASTGKFVREVMRKHLHERQHWRGSDYPPIPNGLEMPTED